jgi:polyhydroxyalkanoate synthase
MAAGDDHVRKGRSVREPADAVTGAKHAPQKGEAKGRQAGDVESVASSSVVPASLPGLVAALLEQVHPWQVPDSHSAHGIDKAFKAKLARFTLGLSPAGIGSKYFEWFAHLLVAPGKQLQLIEKAQRKAARLMTYAASSSRDPNTPPCIEPLAQDRRFNHETWRSWPHNLSYQYFLLTQQWWHNATTDIDGLSDRDEQAIAFVTRQMIDHFSPSNFVWTNPEVMQATLAQGGNNLVRGFQNFLEDWERLVSGKPPAGAEQFEVGRNVAITPGKVVYRNQLIELIQYLPATDQVHPEPILIMPAWIMKYYILDLSPHNSMVKCLVERGFTVFMISWRNPSSEHRDLGMDDYLELGINSALRAVKAMIPDRKVHAVGYCLGGTLLAIAAAALARDGDDTLKTLTLLTAQTDFTEAGELMMLVRESGLSMLESMMWDQGYLDTKQMAGAFQMLRSTDMVWSRLVREYMLGERSKMVDMMAWNADATRMPYRMHSEYLRRLYLGNELAGGQYRVGRRPVTLRDVSTPIFAVATTTDHVAPWQSVYKLHLLTDADVTFVLTTGGHNAGIVSEPSRKGRRFQIATRREHETYVAPEQWLQQTPVTQGSWWPAWTDWLAAQSQAKEAPPPMGSPAMGLRALEDAPGSYVRQR